VISSGGPTVAAPKVVPVFFANDPLESSLEGFLGALATSSYWTATTSEYGVGALSVAPSIVSKDPPPATDDALASWLATQPGAGSGTVFAVFYPEGASLAIHGKGSCDVFDGYHKAGSTTSTADVVYAVSMRCVSGDKALDALTVSMSHELVEAATDPFYYTDPAFASADAAHAVYTLLTVGELGDMCEIEPAANARLVGSYDVQRSWSNVAAAAGHDPCVPAPAQPYFTAAPSLDDDVVIDTGQGTLETKGIRVPVGETKTIDVVLYSDAATAAWRVEARDDSALVGGKKTLELSLDRDTGKNGDVLHLTIHALAAGRFGGSALVLTSTDGTTKHVALGFVAN
jgi:hypothetical protein